MDKHKIEEQFLDNIAKACNGNKVVFLGAKDYLKKLNETPVDTRVTNESLCNIGLTNIVQNEEIYICV